MGLPILVSLWVFILPVARGAVKPSQSNGSFNSLFYRAHSLRAQGEFELALQTFARALSISRQERSFYKEGKCLLRLGILSWDLGDIPGSSSYFHAAKNIFEKIDDRLSHEFCLTCLEIVRLYSNGKADRGVNLNYSSLAKFAQAIRLGRELGLPGFELKCFRQKGMTYWQLGEFNLFLECNQRGLEIASRINHKIEIGRCLNNIGIYYQKQYDYSLSLYYFERALSYIKRVDDKTTEAECLNNIGILYRDLGDLNKALGYLLEALELDKSTGNTNSVSIDMDNIGSVLLRRGIENKDKNDLSRALNVLNSCLSLQDVEKISPTIRSSVLNNLGIIKSDFAEYDKARQYFASAMEFVNKGNNNLEKCNILINIAASYLYETRINDAINYFLEALDIGSANSLENVVIESCLGLGQCYEAGKKPSEALLFYKRSVDVMERIRGRISSEYLKIGFGRNKMNAYHRILKILSDIYMCKPSMILLEDIFQYIEKAKARIFFESINESRVSTQMKTRLGLREQEQQIACKITEINQRLATSALAERARDKLCKELEREEEKYVRLFSEMRDNTYKLESGIQLEASSIAQVRSQLIDDHTGLLEYFLSDDRSYLIFISKKKAKLYELPTRNEISKSLRAYIKIIESGPNNCTAGSTAAKRIGKEIVPLAGEGELDDLVALIVIPDNILHYLPFETLPANNIEPFTYLVEKLAISYCPSASSLLVLKHAKELSAPRKELLAIGGPFYESAGLPSGNCGYDLSKADKHINCKDGVRFSPLPFSKKEVSEIGKLFPGKEKSILIGKDASEGAIKKLPLDRYRLIHFACHGFIDEKYPLRSSLVLSLNDQQMDDGFLQMREIYNLEINADLVVLSACQTGNGVLERAEGPMGITRPFFYAGARSVISSLWPINDKATVFFMKAFYGFLVEGYATNKALQLTKNMMLHSSWSCPFYWASFILSGDPVAVSIGK